MPAYQLGLFCTHVLPPPRSTPKQTKLPLQEQDNTDLPMDTNGLGHIYILVCPGTSLSHGVLYISHMVAGMVAYM